MKSTVKFENGKIFELQFPSIKRVKRLAGLLGVDLFESDVKLSSIKAKDVLGDDKKALDVLNCCLELGDDCNEVELLDEMTVGDFELIVSAFFLESRNVSGSLSGELGVLKDFIGTGAQLSRLKDSLLTLRSSLPEKDARSESIT